MTTISTESGARPARGNVQARPSGFLRDLWTVAQRALRGIPREPEAFYPALFIPTFFYIVNVGALQDLTESVPTAEGFDYRAFQLPTAIIFAVTGVSRAPGLVNDILSGYLDRLLLSPARRLPLLLGLMVADFILVLGLCVPVVILGFLFGVNYGTGLAGILVFILIGALWGLAFTGFPYAIALKTGNAAAVASSFLLFFPFAFLTSSTVPLDALTGWMRAVARFNPITYVLEGQRSLLSPGWDWAALGQAFLAIAILGAISQALAMAALRGRLKRG
jgi:ABC-2 type transport system permease protein